MKYILYNKKEVAITCLKKEEDAKKYEKAVKIYGKFGIAEIENELFDFLIQIAKFNEGKSMSPLSNINVYRDYYDL